MERKDLKFYEVPEMEVVELDVKSPLLEGSPTNADGIYDGD